MYQQTLQHVNWLQPESIVAPIIIAVIILIVCALIAVNMILLLCAAWIVLYAGLIFLGFGGCRWTSDMAINYYRTVLGVGSESDDHATHYRDRSAISATTRRFDQPEAGCEPASAFFSVP